MSFDACSQSRTRSTPCCMCQRPVAVKTSRRSSVYCLHWLPIQKRIQFKLAVLYLNRCSERHRQGDHKFLVPKRRHSPPPLAPCPSPAAGTPRVSPPKFFLKIYMQFLVHFVLKNVNLLTVFFQIINPILSNLEQ
jgi:hypothetical protein